MDQEDDMVPLPAALAGNRSLYRGVWRAETRQDEVVGSGRRIHRRTRRDIWITLPSGRDLKVTTFDTRFTGLPGQCVGVVRCDDDGWLIAAVNYETGESGRYHNHSGKAYWITAVVFAWLLSLTSEAVEQPAQLGWWLGVAVTAWAAWRAVSVPASRDASDQQRFEVLIAAPR